MYKIFMNSILFIRKHVLAVSQVDFAAIAEVTQATVSRWEACDLFPDIHHMNKIRAEVLKRDLAWKDTWFFEVPHVGHDINQSGGS